jgi:hypothetical protein
MRPLLSRPWTEEESEQLRAMVAAGKSWAAISARTRRTVSAVKTQYYRGVAGQPQLGKISRKTAMSNLSID